MSYRQEYSGRQPYRSDYYVGAHRLFVAVSCQVGDVTESAYALLDTAAEWCVLSAELLAELGFDESLDYPMRLETRLGSFYGRLERLPVRFLSEDGETFEVEATWFVCPDWPGPLVLGWKGLPRTVPLCSGPE